MQERSEVHPPDLVVIGELNIDLLMERIQSVPEIGKEKLVDGMTLTLGSSSAILAANAASLGTRVGFVGRIGDDIFGSFVMQRLQERGIDVRHVTSASTPTGATVIFTTENDRGMLTYPGAMQDLTIRDVPWDYVASARHLHLSSYYLQTGLQPDCAELFRRAREMGLSTSLDTNWDPDERWEPDLLEVLDHVDFFFPNREEALLISGEGDLDAALRFFADRVGTVIVTCGAEGVRARCIDQEYRMPAPALRVVDAVGAGDSFNAGFLHSHLVGDSLEACIRYGVLTSAYSTTWSGGTAAFEHRSGFEDFIQQHLALSVRRFRSETHDKR